MNSKERVLAAARRERTDRPPTGLRCTPEAWQALREYLGVETNDDVLDTLDIDLRWMRLSFAGPAERSAIPLGSEGTDFWGCHMRKVENDFNTYIEFDRYPLGDMETVEEIEGHDWPSLDWWDYEGLRDQIATANRKEPRACLLFAGGAFETPWYMRGMQRFMVDLVEHPDIVDAICSHVERYYRERALKALEVANGGIDIVGSGGDIGGQNGLMLSPDLWRKRIKPYTGRLISTFKEMGLVTFYHSCGSIVPVIDDFVELGLDILEPIQVTARGMTPEELAPAFADRISFHGAIDEVNVLPHATADEVYAHTTHVIDVLGQNGGYIVAPTHQVQGDTPPENVVAIFDAARDYRWS